MSKTPVRDALVALEIEGYLMSLPRKGYLVTPVTQKAIRESFQMRLILEKAAVTKLMWALGQTEVYSEIQELMKKSMCGEINSDNE